MKLIYLFPILFTLSCASSGLRMTPTAKQQTLAKGTLNRDVVNTISMTERAWGAGCASPAVTKVVNASSPRSGSGGVISAKEHWFVDRCGREVVYEVKYDESPGSGTAIGVKLIKP